MDKKRLQEIKEFWNRDVTTTYVERVLAWSDINKLIAALEEARAELAEERKFSLSVAEQMMDDHKMDTRYQASIIADLRKQLEELKGQLKVAHAMVEQEREQLKEAQADTQWWKEHAHKKTLRILELQEQLTEMTAYADKLAEGLPCLPKDVEVMKSANWKFAQENHELKEVIADLRRQLEKLSTE